MSNSIRSNVPMMGTGAMLAAPRQFWLATLGAAAVTRGWARKEAGTLFRSLVKEGTVVESQAIRFVGHRIEASVRRANAIARDTRDGVATTVESLAQAASFVRSKLPTVRARIDVGTADAKGSRVARAAKPKRKSRAASTRTARARTRK